MTPPGLPDGEVVALAAMSPRDDKVSTSAQIPAPSADAVARTSAGSGPVSVMVGAPVLARPVERETTATPPARSTRVEPGYRVAALNPPGVGTAPGLATRAISPFAEPLRVFAAARADQQEIDATLAALTGADVDYDAPAPVAFPISRDQVRYYHAADRPAARRAAAAAGAQLRDFTSYRPPPEKGTIELWLAGPGAERVATRQERSEPVARKPVRIIRIERRPTGLLGALAGIFGASDATTRRTVDFVTDDGGRFVPADSDGNGGWREPAQIVTDPRSGERVAGGQAVPAQGSGGSVGTPAVTDRREVDRTPAPDRATQSPGRSWSAPPSGSASRDGRSYDDGARRDDDRGKPGKGRDKPDKGDKDKGRKDKDKDGKDKDKGGKDKNKGGKDKGKGGKDKDKGGKKN